MSGSWLSFSAEFAWSWSWSWWLLRANLFCLFWLEFVRPKLEVLEPISSWWWCWWFLNEITCGKSSKVSSGSSSSRRKVFNITAATWTPLDGPPKSSKFMGSPELSNSWTSLTVLLLAERLNKPSVWSACSLLKYSMQWRTTGAIESPLCSFMNFRLTLNCCESSRRCQVEGAVQLSDWLMLNWMVN